MFKGDDDTLELASVRYTARVMTILDGEPIAISKVLHLIDG